MNENIPSYHKYSNSKKKKSHMNIRYSLALVPEMVFLCINGHVLNPWSLKSFESVIGQFIQMTEQLLNEADEVTLDWCQIQTNDLVVSNLVNHISLNAQFI